MKISRVGILTLLIATILSVSGCGVVNRVRARNELNDGAKAYKERKFDEAQRKFERALELDPDQKVTKTFLARSLHQQFLANRNAPEAPARAERAIQLYKELLQENPNDEATNRAVSNMLEITQGQDAQVEWLTQRANNEQVAPESRADAMTSLASKQYNCANDITEAAKQNVVKEGKADYEFKKPADPAEFDKARQCTQRGMELIDRALALSQNSDSTWSYKASMLVQAARLAEMDNNMAESDRLMAESDQAKQRFLALSEEKARKREEEEARKKEEEEAKK